jgi:hypothetical protein
MEGSGEQLPPVPSGTMRRLEEALQTDEKGGEAELFTQSYNLFDGQHCAHRATELEYEERGDGFVIRRSGIVDELSDEAGKSAVMLTYTRTFTIDAEGNEALEFESQRLCYEEINGDIRACVELPTDMSLAEADFNKIDKLIWKHVEEIKRAGA